ncbi:hypothetical protein HWV62_35674 [Athelia sp. TMB]|nr:hypothetical protein HWV62_35674 [Athelia sp. TMB]
MTHTLVAPACVAGVLAILGLRGVLLSSKRAPASPQTQTTETRYGAVFAWNILRLIGCLALFGLSITSLAIHFEEHDLLYVRLCMCITFAYATILAAFAALGFLKRASHHLTFLLVVTFGIYAYRDIYPLGTFDKSPVDLSDGDLLWPMICILGVTGVVIPLFTPRAYTPFDPEFPSPKPSSEQTASPLGLALWTFLDPIILLANRVSHLAFDQLPPLADSDEARNLAKKAFPILDPFATKKKRHIFWGFLSVYRYLYMEQCIWIILQAFAQMASPIGISGLLAQVPLMKCTMDTDLMPLIHRYMQSEGEGSTVRPWVWILWLLMGPTINSIISQMNYYLVMRMSVHTESIITRLVFEHALRIRMKTEASESLESTNENTPTPSTVNTPDSTSIADSFLAESTTITTTNTATPSRKGKKKLQGEDTVSMSSAKGKTTSQRPSENLTGRINNLVSTDLGNITDGRNWLWLTLYVPLQIALCVTFLYRILGWSSFVGIAIMIICLPIPGYVAKQMQSSQREKMKTTDDRIQKITETLGILRMVKLFGWEGKMNERLRNTRDEELFWTKKIRVFTMINTNFNCERLWVYSRCVFPPSSMDSPKSPIDRLKLSISYETSYSWDFNPYLHASKTEILDAFAEGSNSPDVQAARIGPEDDEVVGFFNATFSWSGSSSDGTLTPSRRQFLLQLDGRVIFKRDAFNMVVGPTGSGKTSLLMALLGEMHFIRAGSTSWFNLPRAGGIAYAAQESSYFRLDFSHSMKNNILFGAPYDEARYKKVLYQCALMRDLELFDAGDETEVGEKGLTLSGGQKARVTLARAVYSSAKILLLDDVLAALDVHTSKWIVDKCFLGDLIKGRTVILVTHNIAMVGPIAQFVLSLGTDGRIVSQGTISEALVLDETLAQEEASETEIVAKAVAEIDPDIEKTKPDGTLIVAENIAEGRMTWATLKTFFFKTGGEHPFVFWAIYVGLTFSDSLVSNFGPWWLGVWASQYETRLSNEVSVLYYMVIYTGGLLFNAILYTGTALVWIHGSLRLARMMHRELVDAVLGTTLRWLDKTPLGRIVSRLTNDIRACGSRSALSAMLLTHWIVDGPIANDFHAVVALSCFIVVKLSIVVFISPIFIFPSILVICLGLWCGNVYTRAVLPVKREMNNSRSPILAHFGAAIAGLVSIRAYGAQSASKVDSETRIDKYTRTARTFYNLACWISLRIEVLSAALTAALAAYFVYGSSASSSASSAGFSLTLAATFTRYILWWVRRLNDFEVSGSSLERIQEFTVIEQEPAWSEGGVAPAYWPASGELRVEELSARYSKWVAPVSSLTLALLRCIFTEGSVYYDGLPTHSLNLDALRSNITIIPQSPELLTGTLRQNLDPFDQYDDATLNDALRGAGLFSLQSDMTEGQITLDSEISSGGGNLSVGQRQILALARALVRGSKLLILDEATSAIDYKTDSVIQASLRNELSSDVTLITVAHRLQTIMDADRILIVVQKAEFDSPAELLRDEKGKLRALVNESKDKDVLLAMVAGQASDA